MIKVYNTLSRKKEEFVSIEKNKVKTPIEINSAELANNSIIPPVKKKKIISV